MQSATSTSSDFHSSYDFDLAKSEIVSKLTGWRLFMMSSNAWTALREELYRKFSSGAEVILLDMGESVGSELVASLIQSRSNSKVYSREKPDPRDFSRLVMSTGWGRVNLLGDLEFGTHITVVVTNCIFCEGDPNLEHRCPFLRGVGVGIASSLYGKEFTVSAVCSDETRKEDHVCKFELLGK